MDDIVKAALADAKALEERAESALADVSNEKLSDISELAEEQVRLEDFIIELDDLLKKAKENLRLVSEVKIPELLQELGMKSFELEDGSKISVSKKYIGSVTKSNQEAFSLWLEKTKREGVLTVNVNVPFDKGHLKEAREAASKIKELGLDIEFNPSVHWQTLRALTRELYESGEEIPPMLSTHVIDQTKIKRK